MKQGTITWSNAATNVIPCNTWSYTSLVPRCDLLDLPAINPSNSSVRLCHWLSRGWGVVEWWLGDLVVILWGGGVVGVRGGHHPPTAAACPATHHNLRTKN